MTYKHTTPDWIKHLGNTYEGIMKVASPLLLVWLCVFLYPIANNEGAAQKSHVNPSTLFVD